jgi:hypothetical protein
MKKRRTKGDNHGLVEYMMAVADRKQTKNPKIQAIRKLMDQQGGKTTYGCFEQKKDEKP